MSAISIPIPHPPAIPPPPPVIVLLDCTDLDGPSLDSLLNCEDLDPSHRLGLDITHGPSPAPSVRFVDSLDTSEAPILSPSTPRSILKKTQAEAKEKGKWNAPSTLFVSPPQQSSSLDITRPGSSASTSSSSTDDSLTLTFLIMRPKNAGIQNLEKLLGWTPDEYKRFRAAVSLGCKDLLDLTKSYISQDEKELKKLRGKILDNFPKLQDHENTWPLELVIEATLKSSSLAAQEKIGA